MDLKSASKKSYYELLGVAKDATPQEIRSSYHELARVYHPDSNFYSDIVCEKVSAEQVELFKLITCAYQTLIDPAKREQYNVSIAPLIDEKVQIWDNENNDSFWSKQPGTNSDMTSKRVRAPTFGKTGVKPFKSNVTISSTKINLKNKNSQSIKRPSRQTGRIKPKSNRRSLVAAVLGIALGVALIGFAKFSKIKEIIFPSEINNQIQTPDPAEWKNKLNS